MKLLGRIRHPPCAVCRKPVDGLLVERDSVTGSLTFTAWCHGATESVTLTDNMLDGAIEVTVGPAFARPALEAA